MIKRLSLNTRQLYSINITCARIDWIFNSTLECPFSYVRSRNLILAIIFKAFWGRSVACKAFFIFEIGSDRIPIVLSIIKFIKYASCDMYIGRPLAAYLPLCYFKVYCHIAESWYFFCKICFKDQFVRIILCFRFI